MMRTVLHWLSSFWEFIKEPGGFLVLIGVTFESIFEWTNWPKDEERRKKLKRTFGLVLILGLIMELPETAKLRQLASAANERASTNEVQVAILESNNLILRSNVMSLELKVKPRTITAEQEANLINLLKPFVQKAPKSPNRVIVEYVLSDSDSDKYARRLSSILTECGFDVQLIGGVPMEPSPNITGLVLNVRDPLNAPPQADAILNALKIVGLTPSNPISSGNNPSVEQGVVEIMVGKKRME